jgi:mRNA interferase RelE/StbE
LPHCGCPRTSDVARIYDAQRNLRRLPEKIGAAVVEFVYGSLADNPERVGRALRMELASHHAARRGDYRVGYRIIARSTSSSSYASTTGRRIPEVLTRK